MFFKKKNKSLGAFRKLQSGRELTDNFQYRTSLFEMMMGRACMLGIRSGWERSTLELLEAYYEYKRGQSIVHILHETNRGKKHNHREFLLKLRQFRKEFRKLAAENKI